MLITVHLTSIFASTSFVTIILCCKHTPYSILCLTLILERRSHVTIFDICCGLQALPSHYLLMILLCFTNSDSESEANPNNYNMSRLVKPPPVLSAEVEQASVSQLEDDRHHHQHQQGAPLHQTWLQCFSF